MKVRLIYALLLVVSLLLSACGENPTLTRVPDNRPKLDPASYPPILFVHGNGDQAAVWMNTIWLFESNGYPADHLFTIDLKNPTASFDGNKPSPATTDNDAQRVQLAANVDEILAKTGAKKLALAGNSRGGLVIRNYVERGGGASKVSHIITGGTPNHGVLALPLVFTGNEFNGNGDFQNALNGDGQEVVPGIDYLAVRSDHYDKFAQPRSLASPLATGYVSPELKGATNIVLEGLDHRETSLSPRAFGEMYKFITGIEPRTDKVTPEANPRLSGRITGMYNDDLPTNTGLADVKVSVFEVDSASGQRKGEAVYRGVTDAEGNWGNFTGRPDAYYEFMLESAGRPDHHYYRSPFPRSTNLVSYRMRSTPVVAGKTTVFFYRPRGYFSPSRDTFSLDGKALPGVEAGVPTISQVAVTFSGPERAIPAILNQERITVRNIPGSVVFAEFSQ
ncbi:MAG TPA: alpha/beta fold hydrolase [Chloroflexia bacterium]|nr:alpha/beta fold hydrolase [Chloroflexia bacterium]